MRIAVDHGLGPLLPGVRKPRPGEETSLEQVLVIRRERVAQESSEGPRAKRSEGQPIPGTDYLLRPSEEAALRDAEVRSHEKDHLATLGGAAASGIMLTTRLGPDGKRYAVGGAIKADLTPVPGDPKASLDKAQRVIRAALAPGNPSAADLRVAADAYRLARESREEITNSERYA